MDYRIIDGAENMKMEDIQRLLKMTYWADKRSSETVEKSVKIAGIQKIHVKKYVRMKNKTGRYLYVLSIFIYFTSVIKI